MKHFYNQGFGWVCKNCEQQSTTVDDTAHSRLLREGEAESKNPRLSTGSLAKWTSPERNALICPVCGVTEKIA